MEKDLLIKAENNIKTGTWAEENELFDTAVSRFYYALFQKILYILKNRYNFSRVFKEDSHKKTINTFKKKVLADLEDDEKVWIYSLGRLKRCRVCADYEERIIVNRNDFNLEFKAVYNNVSGVLEKFIPKELSR